MAEFLGMGGYAAYVWPAYGAAILILAGLTVGALRRSARVRAELALLEARAPRRKSDER